MQRTFITNLIFLLLLNLLIKPVWLLFFDVTVQEQVGETDYGIYAAVLNFTFLFNILPDLGITNFNNRNIAMHNHLLDKHFSVLLTLRMMLGLIFMGIMLLFGWWVGYDAYRMELLAWLALNQLLISAILYFRSNLNGLLRFREDSVISVLDKALMIVICSILLYGNVSNRPFHIRWFVWLQTIAYGLTAFVAFVLVARQTIRLRFHFNCPFSLMILRQSLPFALLFVLMSVYNRSDMVMIERMLANGPEQAGIYIKGYRLLDAFNMFAMLFAGMLLPLFAFLIKKKMPTGGLLALAFQLLTAVSVVTATVCFCYGTELMEALYDHNVASAAPIFRLLMLSTVAISVTYVFGTLLTAGNFMKPLNIMALGGVFMNLGMNYFLIPVYGAWGAAMASVVTQFLTAVVQVVLVHHYFNYQVNRKLLFLSGLFVSGMCAMAWGIHGLDLYWLTKLFLTLGSGIAWAFVTRMIHLRALVNILRQAK